jgi:hypothetical protein
MDSTRLIKQSLAGVWQANSGIESMGVMGVRI